MSRMSISLSKQATNDKNHIEIAMSLQQRLNTLDVSTEKKEDTNDDAINEEEVDDEPCYYSLGNRFHRILSDSENVRYCQDDIDTLHSNDAKETQSSSDNNNNNNNDKNMIQRSKLLLFKRMHSELMNCKEIRLLYLAILFTLICGILRLMLFIFIGSIIDLFANTYDYDYHIGHSIICSLHEYIDCSTNKSLGIVFIITLFILSIIISLSKLSQSLLTTFCCNSFIKRINCLVFDKIIYSDLSFFDCTEIEDLRDLLRNDMKYITKTLYSTENMIESLVYFICCIIYLFMFSWQCLLIIISGFILLMVVSIIYHNKTVQIYRIRTNAFKIVVITMNEMLNYIETIKTFSKEDDESFLYQQCIKRAFKFDKKKKILLDCYRFWISLVTYFTILCIVLFECLASQISIGQIMINFFVFFQLIFCMHCILKLSNKIYPESIERILNILCKEEKNKINNNYIPPNDDEGVNGLIEMKNIEFSYLNDISLSFKPSSMTALVVMNGYDKSLIFKLMMKFYLPHKGRILIDDMDINEYNVSFLHSQIGYIGENIHLFENRTIADNIRFGIKLDQKHYNQFDIEYFDRHYLYFWRQFKSIKQSDVENAAKIANAHEFIMQFKNGYNTIIGGHGNGVKLSDDQKQKIVIARTILLKPKILLIDEAMSHLNEIQKSLDKIINTLSMTVIVIAHRLNTVQCADIIHVIDNGKIIQSGNHKQLIQIKNGQYFKLNQQQIFN